MWRILHDSVAGTSHRGAGLPCQDSTYAQAVPSPHGEVLIGVCADGAGSALHSDVGSKRACLELARLVVDFLDHSPVEGVNVATATVWCCRILDAMNTEAAELGVPVRDLASTVLTAIVGEEHALFFQIGDGAIVVGQNGRYEPIFWPAHGEYVNTTTFITEGEFETNLHVATSEAVDEVALFTDGLEMLVLDVARRSAHQEFFAPMFASMRAASQEDDLDVDFRAFLDSPRVNEKTDDDKSLILAVRHKHDTTTPR